MLWFQWAKVHKEKLSILEVSLVSSAVVSQYISIYLIGSVVFEFNGSSKHWYRGDTTGTALDLWSTGHSWVQILLGAKAA